MKPRSVLLIVFTTVVWLACLFVGTYLAHSSRHHFVKEFGPGALAGGSVFYLWALASIVRADRKR